MKVGVLEIELMANMSRLSDDMRRTERVVGDSMTKVERSVASASRALSSLGLGVSIGLIADQMRRTADSFTKLDAQIRLSTKSQQQYNQALGDIRRISTIAQSDISATTMLYTRLLNTTEGMGISQAKLATVTETVSYGLKAYGATSAEAASAALQLSQAMGANRLGGEEFRAVMEAMPNVMKVLAKSMGVPLGELRALSIAGKITTAEMVKAFGDPAVAAEFKKMAERAQTITGAWTVARNELTLLFGEFAKSSGLTQGMISAFNGLAGALRAVAQYIGEITMLLGAWVAVVTGRYLSGMVAARMAQRAMNAAHAEALVMNVARERATLAEITSRYSNIAAIRTQTLAELQARQAKTALAIAEAESTIAQLNHARAAGMLSGHLYIVRQVEMELVVATNALTAANQARAATMAEMVALGKLQTTANAEIAASTAAVARAESLRVAGATTAIGRMSVAVAAFAKSNAAILVLGSLGVAALALKRDFDAAIDSVSKFQEKIRGMDVEALRAARQLEVANVAAMKSSVFSGFNERDILFAERRIRMMDAQIIAAEKLAKAEEDVAAARGVGGGKAAKPVLDRTTILERMGNEMKAANEAELSGKLNNVEKVGVAWANLNDQQKKDAKYLADYEYALNQARIADWRKIRDQIADNITRGIMEGAKAEDVLKNTFKQMVLEPTVKLAVTAGVDWVASMLGNTTATTTLATSQAALIAALNANTAAQGGSTAGSTAGSAAGTSSGTMLGYAAAAYVVYRVAMGFFGHGGNKALGPATYEGTFGRGGNFQGGVRQGYKSESGAFAGGTQYSSVLTGMSPDQIRAVNKTIVGMQRTFNDLGSAIGDLSIRTRDWSASFSGATDLNAALADSMANSLIPALEKFRLAGENLAQTAERLTGVFTTTNTFIVALGVSSKEAFGSLGIASAEARQALIDAAGGVDAFNQKAGSFIQNFLTDAQKLQPALDAVGRTFAELGISGVTTKKQFADLVAAELKLGHYDVVDRLLSVGDAFNAITSSAKATQDQLLSMLKTSSFETLVSYQRARGQIVGGGGAASQINQAIKDAASTLPEENAANQSEARKARKAKALDFLNMIISNMATVRVKGSAGLPDLGIPSFNPISQTYGSYLAQVQAIYDSLPAFATGGDHMGGLRLVGENGPELEATGPSRIYTASQTASMLSDGMSGGGSVADEVRMLRREAAAHAIALNTATQKLAKIADRWDLQGLPPERIAA